MIVTTQTHQVNISAIKYRAELQSPPDGGLLLGRFPTLFDGTNRRLGLVRFTVERFREQTKKGRSPVEDPGPQNPVF
jgi:hypothetical protein